MWVVILIINITIISCLKASAIITNASVIIDLGTLMQMVVPAWSKYGVDAALVGGDLY